MQNEIQVALLISTYNWPQALELVLISVLKQTHIPNEIVIADDGSTTETKALIDKYREKFDIPLKHVWHEDIGFRKTVILNKALIECQADYIIQIDGDIVLHTKFIEDHLRAAQQGYFVQASRAMIDPYQSAKMIKDKNVDISFMSPGVFNRFNALRIPLLACLFAFERRKYRVKGCNLAFWKKDFEAVNGYFNGFEGWGAEDYEFGARLLHAGVKKKRIKLMAIGFHIYHEVNSRANTAVNDRIFNDTIVRKHVYTPNGYRQVIST